MIFDEERVGDFVPLRKERDQLQARIENLEAHNAEHRAQNDDLQARIEELEEGVCELERVNFDLARTIRIWAKASEREQESDHAMDLTFLALDGAATELRRLRNEVPRGHIPYANELDIEIAHAERALQNHVAELNRQRARIEELEAANAAVEEENDLLRDVIQQKHARVDLLTAALTEITDYVSRHHRNLPEDVEPLLDNARAALAAGTTESEGT